MTSATSVPIHFLFHCRVHRRALAGGGGGVKSQTLQFNSHKMLLNNFVKDVSHDPRTPIYLCALKWFGVGWSEIDALRLQFCSNKYCKQQTFFHPNRDEFIMQNE